MVGATAAYPQQFQQQVQTNLRYWRDWLAQQQDNMSRLEQERDSLLRAMRFALKLPDIWSMTMEMIVTFSPYMERWGYWDSWRWLLEHAVAAAQQFGDVANQIQLLMLLGRLSARQADPLKTVGYYRQTIRLARRHNDGLTAARACSNLGFHYIEHGHHWQRAEILCCYALSIFNQLHHTHGLAHTHNHLGLLHTRRQMWSLAQRHLEHACTLWREMGDQHSLIAGYQNLGLLYIEMADYEQTLYYLNLVYQLAELTGERAWVGIGYAIQGRVYLQLKDFVQSETYYRQAEDNFQMYGNSRELARVWNGLGLLYQQQGRPAVGQHYLEQARQLWQNLGIKAEEVDVLLDMGECAMAQNDPAEALARLNEIEQIMERSPMYERYRFLQPRLNALRIQLNNQPGW